MKLSMAGLLSLILVSVNAQPKKIEEVITPEKIRAHIGFLSSDAMRGRDTGSQELKIAAEHIKSQFISWGVQPHEAYPDFLQPVPLKTQTVATSGGVVVGEQSFALGTDALLLSGGSGNWSGELAFLDFGVAQDFESADVEGKIVVTRAGAPGVKSPQEWLGMRSTKIDRAKEKGAVALVELYNSSLVPWSYLVRVLGTNSTSLDDGTGDDFPSFWVNDSNAEHQKLFASKNATAQLSAEGASIQSFISQNIVALVEGTDETLKDEYVVYSAHYDHVGIGRANAEGDTIYNGARDNAVGTVTVMAMAEYFAQYPPKRSALFILFTAEEKGLLGSRYFVENSPVPLDQIVYCFNSDNGGYNDTSLATIIGFERTTGQPEIAKACKAFGLTAIEDPAKEQGLFDRSDNVNFAAKGIPAPTFSMGFTAFDQEIAKYYHQPSDETQSLDYDYLLKFFRAYVYAGLLIADREERPFWVEGDKYYEAGIKLYNGE